MSAASSHPSAAGGTPDGSRASASELSEALVALEHALAKDAAIVGAKAAALARVRTAGLATAPGLVVTTRADVDRITADAAQFAAAVRKRLGDGPLIARSSSVAEDSAEQSMAGRFDTILDVVSADDLVAAVRGVVGSGARVAAEDGLDDVPAVAVLIQPMLDARFGGVCFAAEPVSGRIDRKFVVTSSAGPDAIVSGRVVGVRHLLDGTGRLLHRDGDEDWEAFLDRRRRRHLSWLVDRLGQLFGGPQDVEFLEEVQGRLVVLQSRPVTTALRGTPVGPVYGTGPVAETFPERLSPLEIDLWVPPLRDGLRETLRITSTASRSELRGRPLVIVHDGRVALDLELVGALPQAEDVAQPDRSAPAQPPGAIDVARRSAAGGVARDRTRARRDDRRCARRRRVARFAQRSPARRPAPARAGGAAIAARPRGDDRPVERPGDEHAHRPVGRAPCAGRGAAAGADRRRGPRPQPCRARADGAADRRCRTAHRHAGDATAAPQRSHGRRGRDPARGAANPGSMGAGADGSAQHASSVAGSSSAGCSPASWP